MHRGKRIACLLWVTLLVGFTVYASLDTFVIERAYAEAEAPSSVQVQEVVEASPCVIEMAASTADIPAETAIPAKATPTTAAQIVSTENNYSDGNITITIQEIRAYDSNVYVADVILSSPEYLQTWFAKSVYGRNVTATTSSIAKKIFVFIS